MDTLLQSLPVRAEEAARQLRSTPMTVLVPMLNIGAAPLMLEMAATIVSYEAGTQHAVPPRILVLGVVQVPPDLPLGQGIELARSYRALLDFLPQEIMVGERLVRVDRAVRVAREVASAVCQAADEEGADLVLFYWRGQPKDPGRHTYGSIIDAALAGLHCDVALLRPDGWREAERVLLAVRGGPSAERALGLALPVAERLGAQLTVMHNVPPVSESGDLTSTTEGQAALREDEPYVLFTERLRHVESATESPIATVLTLEDDPAAALLAEAHGGDLLVMGMASAVQDGSPTPNLASTLAHERGLPMLVVRAGGGQDLAEYTQEARSQSPRAGRDLPFERWFVENTYHADEFRDPDEFVKLKRASGLTISVGLLTSRDEKQLYSILTGLKRVLCDLRPIADQIVVVDAGLSHETPELARSLGVEVYLASEILPHVGSFHGRGESWWKSLAVMRGDIQVWLDPRARRFHPTTAMALAGPLLREPNLQLVKAFTRPQPPRKGKGKGKETEDEASGIDWGSATLSRRESGILAGRIRVQALSPDDLDTLTPTQLAGLPPHTLAQVLYPALAGVVSPSGRDMAGRRSALLNAPALTGENNELALLLWVAAEYGTRSIAQVELRHARPASPLPPSLRSALDVLQVLARKLPDPGARRYAEEAALRLQRELDSATPSETAYEVRALGPVERPPMRTTEDE